MTLSLARLTALSTVFALAAPHAMSPASSAQLEPPVAAGQVSGTYGSDAPSLGQVCRRNVTSTLAVTSEPASVGGLTASGTGNSGTSCESATLGSGRLTLAATFETADAEVWDCDVVTGQYTRVAATLAFLGTSRCTEAGGATSVFTMEITVSLLPATSQGWVLGTFEVSA